MLSANPPSQHAAHRQHMDISCLYSGLDAAAESHAIPARACLEDGGGRAAGEAAGRVERVDAEELVEQAAGDAEHGGAAVLALGVELEGLDLGVVVAHPRDAGDVARDAVRRVDARVAAGLRLG